MSGWPNRIFAVFSIVWGLLLIAVLIFAWLARNYLLSWETTWPEAILENTVIVGVGGAIWYAFYRLTRWFDERN